MAYHQFTLPQVLSDFGLTLTNSTLFENVGPVPPSAGLRAQWKDYSSLALTVSTESARSHFLIAPLLGEIWRLAKGQLALYSGSRFDVDAEAGLVGACDFILGYPPQLDFVVAPVMVIVEAKNENVMGGLGQCAAAMVAAQRFNAKRNPQIDTIYGAVSNGSEWKFLRLRGNSLEFDLTDFRHNDPDRLLGILLHITGITPAAPLAA